MNQDFSSLPTRTRQAIIGVVSSLFAKGSSPGIQEFADGLQQSDWVEEVEITGEGVVMKIGTGQYKVTIEIIKRRLGAK